MKSLITARHERVLKVVARYTRSGIPADTRQIAEVLGYKTPTIEGMIDELIRAGRLVRIEGATGLVAPPKAPHQ